MWIYPKYSKNAEFYADLKTVDENVKKLPIKKLQAKKVSKFEVCALLNYLFAEVFGFFQVHLFPIIPNHRQFSNFHYLAYFDRLK